MLKDIPSHGLVSLQFLSALGIFFGIDISILKMAITELYRNLSYRTLSGGGDFSFDSVSDLTSGIIFKIKSQLYQIGTEKKKKMKIALKK